MTKTVDLVTFRPLFETDFFLEHTNELVLLDTQLYEGEL